MKSNTIIKTLIIIAVILGFVSISNAGDRINKRHKRHTDRIYHGVKKGDSTCREYRHIHRSKHNNRQARRHHRHSRNYRERHHYRDRHERNRHHHKSSNVNTFLFPDIRLAITPFGIFPVID